MLTSLPVCRWSQTRELSTPLPDELAQRAQTRLKQGQPGSRGSADPLEACGVDYLFGIFDGITALHLAAGIGHTEALLLLLDAGAPDGQQRSAGEG